MRQTTVINSFIFKFVERVSVKLIAFVLSIVLARLLEPKAFGMIAIISVFVNLSQVIVQGGLNIALIQQKEVIEDDYSNVFWLSFLVSAVLYCLLFFSAQFIASFYQAKELVLPLRVLALNLFFGAFNSVQTARLSREMRFRAQMNCNLVTILFAGVGSVLLAYHGFGLWALVAYYLFNQVVICFAMMFVIRWRPRLTHNFSRVKSFVSFGWKLLASNLLYSLYGDVRSLIIGKINSPAELAMYDRGNQIPNMVTINIDNAAQTVMLAVLSREQSDLQKVRSSVSKMIRSLTYIVTPCLFGMAAMSAVFVRLFLTEQWIPCIPFMVIFCLGYVFNPVGSSCGVAIKAIGRSDISLVIQIIRVVMMLVTLLICVGFFRTPMAIAIGYILDMFIEMFVLLWPTKRLIGYNYADAFRDFIPNVLLSGCMACLVFLVGKLPLALGILFILQIVVGTVFYLGVSWLFHLKPFLNFKEIVMTKLGKPSA